ncbi:BPS1-LIKE PROTEIN [Salix viminalis]|uniref:BPS1-LIKE PROTEIN n=1 Tax=Salix viminalis TaxID=40686 RepID=A0A9Q0NSV1_SALVM|nr:BPS1-LIKE PROTEIN [Salix viminalis]KAJ6675308.1 BPS1-LIKE PROTEIN [Salix viminalis]KAJ6675309.1 BPS1-LIKE PROTEIN [Salix viminalis]KAJ6675310.1 BPS1-LIKE PROTEIN [Salix viminalis]KAJ6675311.1 BPS1-LIKE PROTEIN [Salix viminalis]
MSQPQEPHRPFFPFGNPFRMLSPKGSQLSPRLLSLLNMFEEAFAARLRKLNPKDKDDVLSLTWMKLAMESLCETHTAIKTLITELELPVTEWDAKWIDVYLDITVKLLDICIAFSSEISRLSQGHLFLQCALHKLECNTSEKLMRACSSLDSWRQHIGSKNPRLGNCKSILESLVDSLTLPKVKNSDKGKVLMRAMYGVKVQTVFVCSVFASAFSVDSTNLLDLDVPNTVSWARAYSDLQTTVNGEIRDVFSRGKFTFLKELDEVDAAVNNLYPMIQDGMRPTEMEAFRSSFSDLGGRAEKLSQVLDVLAKEVDGFFKIVLSGRDALLCNLRVSDTVADPFPGNSWEQVRG